VNRLTVRPRPAVGAVVSLGCVHELTKEQARRIAVRAQLLDAPRPTGLLDVVERLTLLQIDPTAAIAPNADLVLWSRLGSSYRPEQLTAAVQDRALFEHDALIRPMGDLPLVLAAAGAYASHERTRAWLAANDSFRRDVVELLRASGPLASRDVPDTAVVPWASSGWTNDRNVTQMLELLMMRGEVAVAGRVGRERLWDVPERVYPSVEIPSPEAALRRKNERRLASLGIARAKSTKMPLEPVDVGDAGEPAVVEGVKGQWRVDPAYLGTDAFEGRTALLSPFDRLIYDRRRSLELFEFEYTLEMYKPAPKRRWGYFALPILHGYRLVGKLDAAADRKAGVLRVNAVHEDVRFTRELARGLDGELADLARRLGLELER